MITRIEGVNEEMNKVQQKLTIIKNHQAEGMRLFKKASSKIKAELAKGAELLAILQRKRADIKKQASNNIDQSGVREIDLKTSLVLNKMKEGGKIGIKVSEDAKTKFMKLTIGEEYYRVKLTELKKIKKDILTGGQVLKNKLN